jgi:hypothetical protein
MESLQRFGDDVCFACGVESGLTWHHLVPKTTHQKEKRRRGLRKDELSEMKELMCRDCHSQLHSLVSEKELASEYDTVDKILAHPEFAKYVKWKRKHPVVGFVHRRSNSRRRR